MPNMRPDKNPMPHQDPQARACNFSEVALGYTREQAMDEAARCLNCKHMPCVAGCPVQIRIPEFIAKVAQGDFEGAYQIIAQDSALPAVCGRVCPQESQCEAKCVRGIKNEPVGIGRLERFVADWHNANATEKAVPPTPNGHKVAVIGSGPAGLTCAGDLAKKGYDVTVFEALHLAGGVLVYGIPEFRLPKSIVQKEVDTLKELGVKVETNMVIGRAITIDELKEEFGFEAVFIGSGGNVAMDAARCAKRLGAEVYIVYRRSEKELPARAEEVEHAKEEGIIFKTLTNPTEILGYHNPDDPRDPKNGSVSGIRCVEMELGEPDASGRRRPIVKKGSEFEIPLDCVIMALGTSPNPLIKSTTQGLETSTWGGIIADEHGLTSRENVYAGGDAVTGAATVILAMGAGKTAAKAIDETLSKK